MTHELTFLEPFAPNLEPAADGQEPAADRPQPAPHEPPPLSMKAEPGAHDPEPAPLRLTTFDNAEGYDELVIARAIPFRTVCEHHLLPFAGVAHVGYLPAERILGLSKLARLVEHFAARPQTQERLTRQVADCLLERLRPRGAGVVLEAEHTCMTLRGVRATGATTITSALLGCLRADPRSRAEFFALAGVHV